MSKGMMYAGVFAGLGGNAWRAEIWHEGFSGAPGELSFPAAEPLLIEWFRKDKHEVICGSAATLRVISPGDRTYVGLYGIAPSQTRLDVYLNGELFWRGCLDPEFYEEPYEAARGYEVELTFSDFGQWERMAFSSAGFLTLRGILAGCLERVDLGGLPVVDSWISTRLSAGQPSESEGGLLDWLMVQGGNFYDEDGEASTLDEVVEGILQPLALRVVQRAGRIIVYDLNGAYVHGAPAEVRWNGDSQTLGADSVYNDVVVTWSQYSRTGALNPDKCWRKDIPTPPGEVNMNSRFPSQRAGGRAEILSYPLDQTFVDQCSAMTLWTSEEGDGLEICAGQDEFISLESLPDKKPIGNSTYEDTPAAAAARGARFFRIVPQGGSEEAEGVALFWRSFFVPEGTSSREHPAQCQEYGIFRRLFSSLKYDRPRDEMDGLRPRPVFRTAPVWIPPGDPSSAQFLKLTMELLVDQRFNSDGELRNLDRYSTAGGPSDRLRDTRSAPFRGADSDGATRRYGNFLYVPVLVEFKPDGSGDTYYWSNLSGVFRPTDSGMESNMSNFYGCWAKMPGGAAGTDGSVPMRYTSYLAYYEIGEDGANATSSTKWSANKLASYPKPHNDGGFDCRWQKNAEGQPIPYPGSGAERYGGGYADESIVPSPIPAGKVPNRYGGTLRVSVMENVWYWANEHRLIWEARNGWGDIWAYVNWVLCKPPRIEMVSMYGASFGAPDDCDVEYRATVNADAREDLKIDTVCGTNGTRNVFARGNYYYAVRPDDEDGDIVRTLCRQGRTAQAEKLLIGTMYSQYGTRHARLSGEADMAAGTGLLFRDANQGGRTFLLTSEELDCIAATSDMELTELSPDEWDELEITEQQD